MFTYICLCIYVKYVYIYMYMYIYIYSVLSGCKQYRDILLEFKQYFSIVDSTRRVWTGYSDRGSHITTLS